ncbi:MAG: phage holin family protein, partial [Candidatus Delongbacteria bacterium]|nr:phage holin family protein [Candidatus Delongbacteria bacterium]
LLQDLWTQIQPVFPPLIMILAGLILLFVALVFLGMTIAALFCHLTQSFWLAAFITMLFFFSLALSIILLSLHKLKSIRINLERSKKSFGL